MSTKEAAHCSGGRDGTEGEIAQLDLRTLKIGLSAASIGLHFFCRPPLHFRRRAGPPCLPPSLLIPLHIGNPFNGPSQDYGRFIPMRSLPRMNPYYDG